MNPAQRTAWVLGAIGLAGAMLGWVVDPQQFHLAWIASVATWWGFPLGSIALLLIHRLTGGAWGEALGPVLRAGAACTPLLLPALAVVMVGLPVYPWTDPHLALGNRAWLHAPFWIARLLIYLTLWLAIARIARRAQTRGSAPAAFGLILLAFSFTFAAIDVVLSLQPRFNSSVFGLIEGTAALLFALSIAATAVSFTAPRNALADIGKLLLALTVLWAYLDFMQFLIVWESNLPDEAAWYAPRMHGGWGAVFASLALLHFLLPFALLLLSRVQRSRRGISAASLLLIVMEVVRGWWTVLPQAPGGVGWIALACTVAFGGIGAGWAMRAAGASNV